jgi:glutamate carboxypeptidase
MARAAPAAVPDHLLEYLQQNREEMLRDLGAFVELESPSDDKARLDEFSRFLSGYLGRMLGVEAQVLPETHAGNHLRVELGPKDGSAPILVLGHFDTVWPAGTLTEMPFQSDGDVARGPGIFDMKAGLVQGIWGLRALQAKAPLRTPVVLLMNSDEELGSRTSRPIIEREGARARAALVLEPSARGAVKTARKGVGIFRVEVTGRAAHAGLEPQKGVSAIHELARLVLDLHGLSDPRTGTTVNVGVIQGGTRPNVTAARAWAEADFRVASRPEAERLERAILGLVAHHPGASISVTGGINRPPMERTPGVAALYRRARRLATEMGFRLDEVTVGGTSDGNFVAALGVPVLDGLGAVGEGAHAPEEWVDVAAMPRQAALFARLVEEIGAGVE